jgi:hypothetical protein
MEQKQSSTTAEGMALVRAIKASRPPKSGFAMIQSPARW